ELADPGSRVIMANDRIRIDIVEAPDMSGVYTVAGNGTMDLDLVGRVQVEGKTIREAEELLANQLEASYFRQATVRVEIAEFVEGALMILGAVQNPGTLPIKGDQVITLIESIVSVGGFADRAADDQVHILRWRPGGRMARDTVVVNVKAMFDSLDFSKDQYLRPRDIIYVPFRSGQEGADEFLALGEVGTPGFNPYTEGMDIIRAVVAAGGVSREARMDAARILRPDGNGGYSMIAVDLARIFGEANMEQNIPVFPGDILFVPSVQALVGGKVYFMGAVNQPGVVALPSSGEASLARTLFAQVGFNQFANRNSVKLIRKSPDGSLREMVVDVGAILDKGDFSDDIPLQDEDVVTVPERIFSF
ncbi:MAG: polysaccharide biosynthesis/export family protein, partial [Kiritimatiellae bacterium]|nr:polysaccharide biosynthesis/export family protein [Kiritimatiellia bacterium]